jgi:acetylornithine deacetylase
MSELGERLAQVIENFPGLRLEISRLSEGIPAFETSAESEIVRTAEQLTASASGSVAFGTEAPFLKALGSDTIVMGPGHIDQAHQPNEYLPLDHIAPCISILEKLIGKFCL